MRILQIAPTASLSCGVGHFALKLEQCLRALGCTVDTVTGLSPPGAADLVLVQYGKGLYDDADLARYSVACAVPVAVFAHFAEARRLDEFVDGFVTLSPGLLNSDTVPVLPVPHPAWLPDRLEDRDALKREFELPSATVIGSSGFLMFHRQFPEVLERLLPVVKREGAFIDLVTSDWFRPSPGLTERLDDLVARYPGLLRYNRAFLPDAELNRRLQACDLLWCWTATPSSSYASGSISDQYASGTRLYAADKEQHAHVLGLPNVVRGPATLGGFVEGLLAEVQGRRFTRHDPAPVSWERVGPTVLDFLTELRCTGRPGAASLTAAAVGMPSTPSLPANLGLFPRHESQSSCPGDPCTAQD